MTVLAHYWLWRFWLWQLWHLGSNTTRQPHGVWAGSDTRNIGTWTLSFWTSCFLCWVCTTEELGNPGFSWRTIWLTEKGNPVTFTFRMTPRFVFLASVLTRLSPPLLTLKRALDRPNALSPVSLRVWLGKTKFHIERERHVRLEKFYW